MTLGDGLRFLHPGNVFVVKLRMPMTNVVDCECLIIERGGVMLKVSQAQNIVPFFGCLSSRSAPDSTQMMHAWDLFLKYYKTKVCLSYIVFKVFKYWKKISTDLSHCLHLLLKHRGMSTESYCKNALGFSFSL